MGYCAKCGADLPALKHETDTRPMAPPAYAIIDPPPDTPPPPPPHTSPVQCRITDIDMPFWSLVRLMVKCAIAAIPALVIVTVYLVFALAVIAAIGIGTHAP